MTVLKNPKHNFAEKIFIDNDEDIIFVIDKIRQSESKRILLIVPQHALLTSSIVNLKLLARRGADFGKTIILVTKNELAQLKSQESTLLAVEKPEEINENTWDFAEKNSSDLKIQRENRKQELIKQRQTSELPIYEDPTPEISYLSEPESTTPVNKPSYTKKIELGDFLVFAGGDITESEYIDVPVKIVEQPKFETEELSKPEIIEEPNIAETQIEVKEELNEKPVTKTQDNIFEIEIPDESKEEIIPIQKQNLKPARTNSIIGMDISKYPKKTISLGGGRKRGNNIDLEFLTRFIQSGIGKIAIGGIVLVLLIGLLGQSMASATLSIVPTTEEISVSDQIVADESTLRVNLDRKTIPLRKITQKRSGSETGTATVKSETGNKSKGVVDFLNKTDKEIVLNAGTRVTTLNGNKVFVLDETIKVPKRISEVTPSTYENAPITAEKYGESYNVSEVDVKVDGYNTITQLSGRIYRPTVGGTTKVATIVSQEEVDALKEKLTKDLKQMLTNDINSLLTSEDVLIEGVEDFKELEFEVTPEIGTEADRFDIVKLEYSLSLYIVNQEDLDKIADELLSKSENENKTFRSNSAASLKSAVVREDGSVTLDIVKSATVDAAIDTKQILNSIKGTKVDEAELKLGGNPQIQSFELETKPFFIPKFLRKLPNSIDKIEIVQE